MRAICPSDLNLFDVMTLTISLQKTDTEITPMPKRTKKIIQSVKIIYIMWKMTTSLVHS